MKTLAKNSNSIDTSLVFTSADRSFDLHLHREFRLGDHSKAIFSTAANHDDAELLSRVAIEHSFKVGAEWPWKVDLRGELVPIHKTIVSASVYKTWSLFDKTDFTIRFQVSSRKGKKDQVSRIGIVHTIAEDAFKLGLGVDSKGRKMAAIRDKNLTLSTDMEGSWALRMHFNRRIQDKWI
eukprot:jgi/Galph1/1723/GphlegSOOS_G414.1